MKFCSLCLLPDTKPDLSMDADGVCNACTNYRNRKAVDWMERKKTLIDTLDKYKSTDQTNWDCIIPVSGGKDSTYQVIRVLEMGYNPLCVVVTTCHLTSIGRENIENIKQLGVDLIEFTNNRQTRQKLNKLCLEEVGDISWPEHVSIFTIPVKVAVSYNIPLIVWGECSQNEYGGPASSLDNNILDRKWLEEFGGLIGLRVSDIMELADVKKRNMIPYLYPTDEDIKTVGVTGIFLGYYIPWCGLANSLIAQAYGFRTYSECVEGSIVNYENLDNYQTIIHDYFKYIKFGFDRSTDIASTLIRRGVLKREDGLLIVKRHEGKFPKKRLGKSLKEILEYVDMTPEQFEDICHKFTNKSIFKTDRANNLIKDADGDLIRLHNP
jgi:N-acetyl sugar amidotransferase